MRKTLAFIWYHKATKKQKQKQKQTKQKQKQKNKNKNKTKTKKKNPVPKFSILEDFLCLIFPKSCKISRFLTKI